MPRRFKPDPYNGFKDDRERCRALNARARYMALACVALGPWDSRWAEMIGWILGLIR